MTITEGSLPEPDAMALLGLPVAAS